MSQRPAPAPLSLILTTALLASTRFVAAAPPADPREIVAPNFDRLVMQDEFGLPVTRITGCVPGPKGTDILWGHGLYQMSQPGRVKTIIPADKNIAPNGSSDTWINSAIYDGKYVWINRGTYLSRVTMKRVDYLIRYDPATCTSYTLTPKDWNINDEVRAIVAIKPGMILSCRRVPKPDAKPPEAPNTTDVDVITADGAGVKVQNLLSLPYDLKHGKDPGVWKSTTTFFGPWNLYTLTSNDPKPAIRTFICRLGDGETSNHPLVLDPDTMKLSVYPFAIGASRYQALGIGDTGYQWAYDSKPQRVVILRHRMEEEPVKFTLPAFDSIHPVFLDGRVYLTGQSLFWIGTALGQPFKEFKNNLWTQYGNVPFYSTTYGFMCLDSKTNEMSVPHFEYAK